MLLGGTELPTGVAEQTPCSDGVVGGQEGACVADAMQRALVRMPYRAQNKFWYVGRKKVLKMLTLSDVSCHRCLVGPIFP